MAEAVVVGWGTMGTNCCWLCSAAAVGVADSAAAGAAALVGSLMTTWPLSSIRRLW